jgi:hypothetical protein
MRLSLIFIALVVFASSWTRTDLSTYTLADRRLEDSVLANDVRFITQKLLKGKYKVNLARYDTIKRKFCRPDKLDTRQTVNGFEGPNEVGDLNGDGNVDYVFVLHPINRCEEGQSYYFSIPRTSKDRDRFLLLSS